MMKMRFFIKNINVKQNRWLKLSWLVLLSATLTWPLLALVTQSTQPVAYSYWAGWANTEIPNFNFNGLFLAFAFMKSDGKGNFYTDYTASGNFQQPSNTNKIQPFEATKFQVFFS